MPPRHASSYTLAASLALHVAAAVIAVFAGPPAAEPDDPAKAQAAPLNGDAFEAPEIDGPAPSEPIQPSEPVEIDDPAEERAAAADAPSRASDARSAPRPDDGALAVRPRGRAAPRSAKGGRGANAPAAPVAAYGALGERGAVDLATAFTRAFPQAASADPSWLTAPFGGAGSADVALTLDPSGRLAAASVGAGASSALRRGIDRTLALIRGRSFTSRARVTTLRLAASVAPDAVHDGLHGDVFAIGGSFAGSGGSAFFALAVGRRVDLSVRAR